MKVLIKPLSVNECWQGRRFKTPAYKAYQTELLYRLPKLILPNPPFEAFYRFGLSSVQSDVDNGVKPMMDILAKKYGFNDKLVMRMVVEKVKVDKGKEFIEFEFKHYAKIREELP